MQLVQGARIKKAGGHFLIAKSVEEVKEFLNKAGIK